MAGELWGWTDDVRYKPDINDCRHDLYRANLHELQGVIEQIEYNTLPLPDNPLKQVQYISRLTQVDFISRLVTKILMFTDSDYEEGLAWYEDPQAFKTPIVRRLVKLSADGLTMFPVPDMTKEE